MKSIYIKEIEQYFKSMSGYIYLGIFLLLSGFYFVTGNLLSQSGDIKVFFTSMFSVLMFIVPILTMRIFAEEKKMRTDQLLFTSPISTSDIVLGKFFATLSVFLIGLAVTLLFPIILALFGSFEFMVTLGNYFGIVLLASAFVSIGLFVSVLTENQIIAAVVTYAILLLLWMVDSVGMFLNNAQLQQVLSMFSLSKSILPFTYGILSFASVVHYISVSVLFLFLSVFALDFKRIA